MSPPDTSPQNMSLPGVFPTKLLSKDMSSPDTSTRTPHWKHGLDLSIILLLLPLLLPVAVAIALWVKIISRGPLLFRQERIGRHGRSFTMYKIRSMAVNAPKRKHEKYFAELVESNRPMEKLDSLADPRLIRGGSFLRSSGLDELPQLINVIRGEMSLVGPRPCLPKEYELYSADQRERFETVPGLTGYWQVNGKNHTTFTEMVELDIHYCRNKSLWLDLAIILRTPGVLVTQLIEHLHVPSDAGSKATAAKVPNTQSIF